MNYSSFSRVIEDYKVVMLDSYGVVKNHKGLIDGVQESIRTLKQKGKTFRLLTNDASRSQEQQLESLQRLGLHDIELHEIITSGMMARQFLEQKITSGRIAYLGTQNSAEYILQSGLQHVAAGDVDLNDIDDIAAFVFLDDEGFDWNTDINKTVNLLRKKTMRVLTQEKWEKTYSREQAVFPIAELRWNKFWPTVSRVDDAYGDRNLVCSCLPIEAYTS